MEPKFKHDIAVKIDPINSYKLKLVVLWASMVFSHWLHRYCK